MQVFLPLQKHWVSREEKKTVPHVFYESGEVYIRQYANNKPLLNKNSLRTIEA